jgi:hypothetical protein
VIGRFLWGKRMRVRSTADVCFSRKIPIPLNSKPYAICGSPVVGSIAADMDHPEFIDGSTVSVAQPVTVRVANLSWLVLPSGDA